MITLTSFGDARDAFRSRDLRQALYDDGHRLMTGVIVNLHGQEHLARRRLENRLFRRDTFAWYEQERIPRIVDAVLSDALSDAVSGAGSDAPSHSQTGGGGRGELLAMARRTMMTLSVDVAGVDLPSGTGGDRFDPEVFDRFYGLMSRLARASTVVHAVGDTGTILAEGDEALARFEHDFFAPARQRRADLIAAVEAGRASEHDLPRDVLTTLLRNQDDLDLPDRFVLREIAYFPWVGSHSTAAQLVHSMHHLFEWIEEHPADRAALASDPALRQRFVHESMRLHPASPVALRKALAPVPLRSGRTLPAGETVAISVEAANRDPDVFGPDPDRFDPYRVPADGVAPWGLSFGHGPHACLGQELAGGLDAVEAVEHQLYGAVVAMAGAMLVAGARPDPDDPPTLDPGTTRVMWGRYPVVFEGAG